MKLFTLTLILITTAQLINAKSPATTEIVINTSTIEKYKRLQADTTKVTSFTTMLNGYTFEEVKSVTHAYVNNIIETIDKTEVNIHLIAQKYSTEVSVYKKKPNRNSLLTEQYRFLGKDY